jgi:hypothetical protein
MSIKNGVVRNGKLREIFFGTSGKVSNIPDTDANGRFLGSFEERPRQGRAGGTKISEPSLPALRWRLLSMQN